MMTKILVLALACMSSTAFADPIAKLCRASTQIQGMYADFGKENIRRLKTICFHSGRVAGAVEDEMTFRDRAREKTPPELLALADQMVVDARELARFCREDGDDSAIQSALEAKLEALAGGASPNAIINQKTCR